MSCILASYPARKGRTRTAPLVNAAIVWEPRRILRFTGHVSCTIRLDCTEYGEMRRFAPLSDRNPGKDLGSSCSRAPTAALASPRAVAGGYGLIPTCVLRKEHTRGHSDPWILGLPGTDPVRRRELGRGRGRGRGRGVRRLFITDQH